MQAAHLQWGGKASGGACALTVIAHRVFRAVLGIIGFFLRDPKIFFKYVAVGGAAATLEFLLFSTFYEVLRLPLLAANGIAIAICIVFSFTLQRQWTFRDERSIRAQLPPYVFMISLAVLFNNLLIYLFVAVWGWNALLSKVLQIGLVFGWNFSFSRLVVFKAKH